VLWAYLDESGSHARDGRLCRLALGGCLGGYADWKRFETEWAAVLKTEGVDYFHMADFEAIRGPFEGWDRSRHQSFLERLLDCFSPHVKSIFGAGCDITDPSARLRESYLRNVKGAVRSALEEGHWWSFPNEKVSIMFAKHPEVGAVHIEQYAKAVEETIPALGSVRFGDPQDMVPLQAADLVAYEIAKYLPHQDIRKMRYPMSRLWGTNRMRIGREGS